MSKFTIPKSFIVFTAIAIVSLLSYYWFSTTPLFKVWFEWAQDNFWLFVLVLGFYRFISLAYPPLVGGVFMIAAVPILGWKNVFILDFIASLIGGTFNYFLAKKYGINFIKKAFGESIANKIKSIKIKKDKEIESIVLLRVFGGSIIIEAMHYAAGILRISFKNYIIAMSISQIMIGTALYYFTEKALLREFNFGWLALILILGLPVLYKMRGRYLE